MSAAPAQYLLTPERQVTLDGHAEPLVAVPVVVEPPAEPSPERSLFLRLDAGAGQLPLPLPTKHSPQADDSPHPACVSGWTSRQCPAHLDESRIVPHLCGRQSCESSRAANTRERARDVWDGTAKVRPVGLRHLLREGVPLGVFVFTLPPELRRLCQGKRLNRFRHEAWQMVVEVLQRHGGGPGLKLWGREYLHPVGEAALPRMGEPEPMGPDGTDYKPHTNILVPLTGLTAAGTLWRGKAHIPKPWMGERGWVQARWRERLVSVFGQWWREGEAAPVTNWFYEPRETLPEQRHALRYFARVFPAWAKHKRVSVRPRALGLANGRKRAELHRVVGMLDAKCGPPPLESGACRHSTPERPCPPAQVFGASSREQLVEVVRGMAARVGDSTRILNNGDSCGRACGPWPTAPPAHVETGPPVWSLPVPTGFP